MRREILALVVAILVVGGLGGSYYVYQTSGLTTRPINPTTYTASNPNLGIRLVIMLNASTTHVGGTVNYSASVQNTRSSENNVSSAGNWALPDLIMTPCGPSDSPIAYAILAGHLDSGNISKAHGNEGGMMCTTVFGGAKVYSFQPLSDMASVTGDCNPNPCFAGPISTWRLFNQYSNGTGPFWVRFTPGQYTVVAEDEWGDVALASFMVR